MDLAANDEVRFILDPSLQPLIDSATDEQSGQVGIYFKERCHLFFLNWHYCSGR